MEEIQGVKWCVSWEAGFIFEATREDLCCVRPVLLYCCEMWELTVTDEARLGGVEHRMIRMMCWVRLVKVEITRKRTKDRPRKCGKST